MSVLGGSDSEVSSKLFNQQQTVSDQGIAIRTRFLGPNKSNNLQIRVDKGGSYNVNNITQAGYSQDQVDTILEQQLRSTAFAVAGVAPPVDDVGVDVALGERINDQITEAPENAAAESRANKILLVVILAIAGLALVFGRGRGRRTP